MSKLNIIARPLNLRLKHPFGIARETTSIAKNVIVTITFDEIFAYGEAAPSMYYGESQKSVLEFISNFIKRHKSLEEYLTNIRKLKGELSSYALDSCDNFSPAARVALEMAFWDLMGKIDNKALYQFFFNQDPFLNNGTSYTSIPKTSFTIGIDSLLITESKVKEAIDAGYKILKIKLGTSFEHDLNVLKVIKKSIGDNDVSLRVDANGAWDIDRTKQMINILPNYNVELLEQPLARGHFHKLKPLLDDTPIPIFVDEDCLGSNDIESLAGNVHGINIKLMKTGSIIESFNMMKLAKSYGLKVMLGCMIESSCGISAAVHLSPMADFVDLDGHLLIESDPFSGLTFEDNKIIPSFDNGLGVSYSFNN